MLFRMLNSKVLQQNLKKKNVNNISFVTTLNKDTDQIIKKNIKIKMENTPSDYINGIFQERNTFLSQHQPKIYQYYSLTLLSPEIKVYLMNFLNAMIKDVKYADFTS